LAFLAARKTLKGGGNRFAETAERWYSGWNCILPELDRIMDEGIARANIEHFKKLLAQEQDEAKLRTLRALLAEEEIKLAAALKAKAERKKG
jgi:hypothetical protein